MDRARSPYRNLAADGQPDIGARMTHTRRMLITGGCGFIGANLVRVVREQGGWAVRVVDDLRSGRREYLSEMDVEIAIGDVADPAVLDPALEDVDAVIHLAAQTGVIPSVENPRRDFEGNVVATFRVLDECRQRGIERFVFASSGAALGNVTPPLHEEVVPHPLSPYGAAKLTGEAYCQSFAGSYGMHAVSLRFSNVYGPVSVNKNNAIPNFIKALLKKEPLHIYGDGQQSRDFIYVDDLCDAILLAVGSDDVRGEVFQLATGRETSVLELIEIIGQVMDVRPEISFEPRRAGEVYKSRVDITKVQRKLGFEPRVSLEEGLDRTVAWFRTHWLRTGN
jgi:UDP-glucose 4-epimerase